ncbi:MAG: alpha/beta hydrolase [Ruminococcus sp.]|nr:alpha/beta hydrolase [Ruminococcus sp.]
MKRIITVLLAAAVITELFAACGAQKPANADKDAQTTAAAENEKEAESPVHTLYYKDSTKSSEAVATFFNSDSGKSEDVEMKIVSEDSSSVTFACDGDTSVYNMAYVICDGKEPDRPAFSQFAFNRCVSGWYRKDGLLMPYAQGQEIDFSPKFDDVTLTCVDYDKLVHIWTPDGYNASAAGKYSTVYVLDGENVLLSDVYGQELSGSSFATEQVKAMTASTGYKAIVVAIENIGKRDFELVPNIGAPKDNTDFEEEGTDGTKFADFVANTLVPYVQKNYNVYTDSLHTAVTGASLGGMECFYIAEEYPDKFGTAGAFSPSYWMYDEATWNKYLGEKSFGDDSPFVYLYTGPEGFDTDPDVTQMYNRLKDMGYPADKLSLHLNKDGVHDSSIWRGVFPEFLNAMVYRKVEPLEK